MQNNKIQSEGDIYPREIIDIAEGKGYYGRMNAPVASAYLKGPCGDEMEFYLIIENGVIKDVNVYTEGCLATRACGVITAHQVKGKSIWEALDVSPKKVMDLLNVLPADHKHCAILAVSTLYRAIADYLLKP